MTQVSRGGVFLFPASREAQISKNLLTGCHSRVGGPLAHSLRVRRKLVTHFTSGFIDLQVDLIVRGDSVAVLLLGEFVGFGVP